MQPVTHSRVPAIPPWRLLLLTFALLVPSPLPAQDEADEFASRLHAQADEIRAAAADLFKLRRIPWTTDVFEGFRLAREEQRPVLLYMITGDPLGDC
jgi:hypothetical protein